MNDFVKNSGTVSLFISLVTFAYTFGIMNQKIDTKEDRKGVIAISRDLLLKERALSDAKYYIRPEVAIKYMTKENFQTFMDAQIMEMKVLILESEKRNKR